MEEDKPELAEDLLDNVSKINENTIDNMEEDEPETAESLLENVAKIKREGNELYRKGVMFHGHTLGKNTMVEACTKYAKALESLQDIEDLMQVNGLENNTDNEQLGTTFTELKVSILLNLAAAGLKMDSFDSALNCCNTVLEICEGDKYTRLIDGKALKWKCKALFRRAKSYIGLGKDDEANEDFLSCIKLEPNNKEVRTEMKKFRQEWKKKKEAELFRLQTELGMKKLELKKKKEETGEKSHSNENENESDGGTCKQVKEEPDSQSQYCSVVTKEWLDECDVTSYLKNGTILEDGRYAWGQTLDEVHVFFRIPPLTRAKQITCNFERRSVSVKVADEKEYRLNKQAPFRFITVDECTWEIETQSCLHVVLFKETITNSSTNNTPGYEWWPCAFKDNKEVEIDVTKCDIGTDLDQLPDDAKREWEKSIWAEQQKTPEEREKANKQRQAQKEFEIQEKDRVQRQEAGMKDPKKKAVYDMMREKFPDIPVEFK